MADAGGGMLDVAALETLLARVDAALEIHREEIDELNVFPVPDGDTGTNMLLTVRAALDALEGLDDPAQAPRAVVRGSLRGARGNSGVILSQVVRALVEAVDAAGGGGLDAAGLADALTRARELAYAAVAEPVEGTILTVIEAAARCARAAARSGDDPVAVAAAARREARAALARTTEQLDALKEAGVVDAGGRGFEVLLDALHGHLTGAPAPTPDAGAEPGAPAAPRRESCAGELTHRFEVQYLLEADGDDVGVLQQRLEVLGDSVVVVAAGGLLNVHVHTDDVGAAIEEGLLLGRPSQIEVTHFGDEIAARHVARGTAVGAVVVLDGPGAHALAAELGAVAVPGHAGALPPVADFLNAVGRVRAERVVLLPGHPNAVPTARQTVSVALAEGGRPLEVVEEADSLVSSLAALAVLDPSATFESVLADMRAAAGAVRSGEVVAAVRDAATPIGHVRRGGQLAVVEGEVIAALEDPLEALATACERLDVAAAEVATLLLGADAPAQERKLAERLLRERAGTDVEVLDTGHRPARYSIGVE